MDLFQFAKKRKYVSIQRPLEAKQAEEPSVPVGLWVKCPSCDKTVYAKELGPFKICPNCKSCFRLNALERLDLTVDEGSFLEFDKNLRSQNPIHYPGYEKKLSELMEKTGLNEAVLTGSCSIGGQRTVLGIMDSNFMMGSMGSVVGEKLTRALEYATEQTLPVVVFTASGGARMQESILSLMQMAKISAAVAKHSEKGLLYLTVITDPTTGGVTASFASLGDIILAEPKALIGFTGARVIEQTIKQKLPDGFQSAEFMLQHGFIDKIVPREEMKETLAKILKLHQPASTDIQESHFADAKAEQTNTDREVRT